MANIADMTVVRENGSRYGADNVKLCRQDGQQGVVFVCSGEPTFIPASEVDRIEVRETDPDESGGLCMNCC